MRPIYGIRDWSQKDGLLYGRWSRHPWKSADIVAQCHPNKSGRPNDRMRLDVPHDTPDPECHCGVYVAKHNRQLILGNCGGLLHNEHTDVGQVLGVIAGYGTVIEGSRGYRVGRASIVSLFAFHSHDLLTKTYGVEVMDDPFEFRRRADAFILEQQEET